MAKQNQNKAVTNVTSKEQEVVITSPRSFNVLKGYDGIEKGEVVFSNDVSTITYMLQQGYWEEV